MAALSAESRHHRARIAALSRDRAPDDPQLAEARQSLAYARLTEHAARVVAAWPDPTNELLQKVAAILRSGSDDRKVVKDDRLAELDGGGDHHAA